MYDFCAPMTQAFPSLGKAMTRFANSWSLYSKRIEGSIKGMQEKTEGKKMEVRFLMMSSPEQQRVKKGF